MTLLQFIGEPIITEPIQAIIAIIFSFFVGIISAALGVGGGFITTPLVRPRGKWIEHIPLSILRYLGNKIGKFIR